MQRPKIIISLFFFLQLIAFSQHSWQMQFPSLSAFSLPIELTHADDGTNRLFVVQQRGIIYVFENNPAVTTRKVFLNIASRVSSTGSETGLLGLAFHPQYPDSPYFYVNYTNTISAQLRTFIARYTVSSSNPDSALYGSEKILLSFDQPFTNHNGGKIAFGKDGYLYIGSGDGGSGNDPGNRAQNRTNLLGKILCINVDSADTGLNYSIPTTNPFYKNSSGFREEIYAYGIRNPWKFSFDELTGALWMGDVGQDAREEIDTVINGGNYGWRLMEGNICTPAVNAACNDTVGLLRPVFDYPNLNPPLDGSITGGFVYRGSAIPALYGKYIYGDYISGRTFMLTYQGVPTPVNVQISDEAYTISTFGTDKDGNIFLFAYGTGRIYKLTGPATNVELNEKLHPKEFSLSQNFPNPFNPSTRIKFSLPVQSFVSLKIFDPLGREVETLVNEERAAGSYDVVWNGKNLSGVYFYQLRTEKFTETKKMTLIK